MAYEDITVALERFQEKQERSLDELNNHLAAIAGQLERIANDIAVHVHEGELCTFHKISLMR